mmetsp:Transcript_11621/g.16124  ORF Transcript_11621/g.16124 Transcript_11621/m.16124 type:complete len:172 (+) Transcript_11621:58-573(+)
MSQTDFFFGSTTLPDANDDEQEEQMEVSPAPTNTQMQEEPLPQENTDAAVNIQQLRFRNYNPQDPTLQQLKIERPEIPEVAKKITAMLDKISKEEPDLNSVNLAPKKANWDLKRDVEKKLEKLEKRTQKAIVEMMREKLQQQDESGNGEDLNRGVNMFMSKDLQESDSEED